MDYTIKRYDCDCPREEGGMIENPQGVYVEYYDHTTAQSVLLEALKTCLDHFNTTDAEYDRNGTRIDQTMMRDMVRDAINKAEGAP